MTEEKNTEEKNIVQAIDANDVPEDEEAVASSEMESTEEGRKLTQLRSIILHNGDVKREQIVADARQDADSWLSGQTEALEHKLAEIESDAGKRAKEIAARRITSANMTRDRDRLILVAQLVKNAKAYFLEKLTALASRPDYEQILAGAALEAISSLPGDIALSIQLSARDASYGTPLVEYLKTRLSGMDLRFDPTPAEITGGVVIASTDGRWDIIADWVSKVEEMSDAIADQILAKL
jgi:V/A-type H+-transporting ATPase subunit E